MSSPHVQLQTFCTTQYLEIHKKDEDTPRTPNTQSVNGARTHFLRAVSYRVRKAGSRAPWPEVGAKIQRVVGKIEREPAARLVRREQPRLGRRAAHEA